MPPTLTFIHHDGEWDSSNNYSKFKVCGVLIDSESTFAEFEIIIASQVKLKFCSDSLEMKYQPKPGYPPITIESNEDLQFYRELKKQESDYTMFPICTSPTRAKENVPRSNTKEAEINQVRRNNVSVGNLNFLPHSRGEVENEDGGCWAKFSYNMAQAMFDAAETTEIELNHVQCDYMDGQNSKDIESGIRVGQIFRNNEALKRKLQVYAIDQQFQFKVEKSCKIQYFVKCIDNSCSWFVKSSRVTKSSFFKIRDMNNNHTCTLDVRMGNQRQATSNIVGDIVKNKYCNPKTVYTPADIMSDMLLKHGVTLNYQKAWRAQKRAKDDIQGKPDESYTKLPEYLKEVVKANPGSITQLSITPKNGKFQYVFMSLNASIKGWKHCRPIVILDGTFLKASFGGTLLTASSQDANSHILPLAFAVVDSENDNAYEWFFETLKSAIGSRPGMCIVSDRHESIVKAITNVSIHKLVLQAF